MRLLVCFILGRELYYWRSSTILTSERELILSTYIVIPTSTGVPGKIHRAEETEAVKEMRPWCVQCGRHSPGTCSFSLAQFSHKFIFWFILDNDICYEMFHIFQKAKKRLSVEPLYRITAIGFILVQRYLLYLVALLSTK